MGQLKHYNESTGQWEPTIAGAQGPQGEAGQPATITPGTTTSILEVPGTDMYNYIIDPTLSGTALDGSYTGQPQNFTGAGGWTKITDSGSRPPYNSSTNCLISPSTTTAGTRYIFDLPIDSSFDYSANPLIALTVFMKKTTSNANYPQFAKIVYKNPDTGDLYIPVLNSGSIYTQNFNLSFYTGWRQLSALIDINDVRYYLGVPNLVISGIEYPGGYDPIQIDSIRLDRYYVEEYSSHSPYGYFDGGSSELSSWLGDPNDSVSVQTTTKTVSATEFDIISSGTSIDAVFDFVVPEIKDYSFSDLGIYPNSDINLDTITVGTPIYLYGKTGAYQAGNYVRVTITDDINNPNNWIEGIIDYAVGAPDQAQYISVRVFKYNGTGFHPAPKVKVGLTQKSGNGYSVKTEKNYLQPDLSADTIYLGQILDIYADPGAFVPGDYASIKVYDAYNGNKVGTIYGYVFGTNPFDSISNYSPFFQVMVDSWNFESWWTPTTISNPSYEVSLNAKQGLGYKISSSPMYKLGAEIDFDTMDSGSPVYLVADSQALSVNDYVRYYPDKNNAPDMWVEGELYQADPGNITILVSLWNGSGQVAASENYSLQLQGRPGPGVASGGLEGQILAKVDDTDFNTQWIDNYAPDTRIIVKNDSGVTLSIGTPVMAVGAVGDRIQVAKAVADGSVEPRFILGVTFEEILDGEEGFLTLTGDIKGVNTNGYTLGDILYINPATPGTFTSTMPSSPNLAMAIAIVTKVNSSAGHIFVRMWDQQSGLHEQHDVLIDTPADNDLVVYTDSLGVWENKTPAEAGLSEIGHDHDDRYYTETETDDLLDAKASLSGATFTGDIVTKGITAKNSDGVSVFSIGNDASGQLELGRIDGTAANPYIDFHSGATASDFDVRIQASGGNGTSGKGTLFITADRTSFGGRINYPDQPMFAAMGDGGSFNAVASTPIVFSSVQINSSSSYNSSNGRFTAPIAGKYLMHFTVYTFNNGNQKSIAFRKNGSDFAPTNSVISFAASATDLSMSCTYIFNLAQGDYIEVGARAASATVSAFYGHSWFQGYMIG